MIKRSALPVLLALAIVTGVARVASHSDEKDAVSASSPPSPARLEDDANILFSAPGVTEPKTKTVQIFSEVSGVIHEINVRAGEHVVRGQLLGRLDDQIQRASVDLSEATLQRNRADLARVRSGDRAEEKAINRALYQDAEAAVPPARFEWQRVQSLNQQNATTEKELVEARRALDQAEAKSLAAKKRWELSEAGSRSEDVSRAEAAVKEADAQLQIARSMLEKTCIRSPVDGIVIYRFREPGEAVFSDVPAPILTVGDRSELHVRVDVDEIDIGNVWTNQQVWVTAPAFADHRFKGHVVHIEPTLGRKNFRTNRPTEKLDTRVLEVVVALDAADDVPIDLQMVIWFLNNQRPAGNNTAQPMGFVRAEAGSAVAVSPRATNR